MPEKDGFETTRHIRNTKKGGRIPIIALTASVSEAAQRKCTEAGMNAFISKPIDFKKLYDILSETLRTPAFSSFDWAQLSQLAQLDKPGEKTFFNELFEVFDKSLPETLKEMNKALKVQEREVLSRIAHRLKGSSYQLGAARLSEICGKLESLALEQTTWETLNSLCDDIRHECQRVLHEGPRFFEADRSHFETDLVTRRLKA